MMHWAKKVLFIISIDGGYIFRNKWISNTVSRSHYTSMGGTLQASKINIAQNCECFTKTEMHLIHLSGLKGHTECKLNFHMNFYLFSVVPNVQREAT